MTAGDPTHRLRVLKTIPRPKRLERLELADAETIVAVCHRTAIPDPELSLGHRRPHVDAWDIRLGKVWLVSETVDLERDVARALMKRGISTGAVELVDVESGEVVKRFELKAVEEA